MLFLAWSALALAFVPALVFLVNLRLYRQPRFAPATAIPSVSVLIPARDEELSIEASVRAALASRDVDLEVIVLDDDSTDATAAIVKRLSAEDSRVTLAQAPPLPSGWNGKQFACHSLAQLAAKPLFCFLDADVRLMPDGLSAVAQALAHSQAALVSGFPRQETVTPLEQLLLPLMHFLLLGFLPIWRMRAGTKPAYAAGCGQLILVERASYFRAGGHAAIRSSRHDGIRLPAAFRQAGLRTDLCDATHLAICRMYRDASGVVRGLLKNADEGLAAPARILPFTVILAAGQILPFLLIWFCWNEPLARSLVLLAIALAYLPRLMAAARFQQPWKGALFHPLAIALLLMIQWTAFVLSAMGRTVAWKGRESTSPS